VYWVSRLFLLPLVQLMLVFLVAGDFSGHWSFAKVFPLPKKGSIFHVVVSAFLVSLG